MNLILYQSAAVIMVFNIIIINNNAVTIEGKGENGDNNIIHYKYLTNNQIKRNNN